MTATTKKLKAYYVSDGDDGACIRFATSSAAARREGAGELGVDWEGIDLCRREPILDQYAPGPVPPRALLDLGWWFPCPECDAHVSDDSGHDHVVVGEHVYCSQTCVAVEYAKHRARQAAEVALIEVFLGKYPDATVQHAYVSGGALEPGDLFGRGGAPCTISFKFPGAKYGGMWCFGGQDLRICSDDHATYYAWQGITPPAGEGAA
jgi:hypothetical protein